jgi:hypothetical protein
MRLKPWHAGLQSSHWRGRRGAFTLLIVLATWINAPAVAEPASPERLAQAGQPGGLVASPDYQKKLDEYKQARATYEVAATAYWKSIADKRRLRNEKRRDRLEIKLEDYVLTQPPAYSGPPRPADPNEPPAERPERKYIPVIADFLKAALDHYKFVPQRPSSEIEYKRSYARVAAAAGLTRDQVVGIYAFESGGNGKYDVQAGLEFAKPNARAISTALGYNQLMHVNSVELMAEQGDRFVAVLTAKAMGLTGPARAALEDKINVVKRMIALSRTVPDRWTEHEKLADTPPGLAMHAMNLDVDVGPLLQTQKLIDSVIFAKRKGIDRALTAAELEMLNLTGDGNGFDMVAMPAALRTKVPTANFFVRTGYERNSVASRNNVVAALIAATESKMGKEIVLQGARDMDAAYPK